MKKVKIIIFFLLITIFFRGYTQQSRWQLNTMETNIEFSFPVTSWSIDTLGMTVYACEVDSLLALQVHYLRNASFNSNDPFFQQALSLENQDTLRAVARLLLLGTNSIASEVMSIQNRNINGLQLAVNYQSLATNQPFYSFIRYFLFNNKFIAFTVTCAESDLQRALSYRDIFFNSINLN